MDSTVKHIARQRIQTLLEQAESVRRTNPQLSCRYVETARKIAMAARIYLPVSIKRRICKNCNTLLVPGENCRVRIKPRREPHVVTTCLVCGFQTRLPMRKRREQKT